MIAAVACLLLCQTVGEVLVRALAVPIPGPVAGMGLLFALLVWNGRRQAAAEPAVPEAIGNAADALLRNLSLLFVPAAVGVIQYLGLLRQHAGGIVIAIVVSTLLALVVTALTFHAISRLRAGEDPGEAAAEDDPR